MWIDFAENIYQYGKCQTISSFSNRKNDKIDTVKRLIEKINVDFSFFFDELEEAKTQRELYLNMAYQVLTYIPVSIFMSFIVVSLTYRTMINLTDFLFRNSSSLTRNELLKTSEDSICCSICNTNDEHENIYSKYDIDYVLNMFDSPYNYNYNSKNEDIESVDLKHLNSNLKYCKLVNNKASFVRKIANKFYEPDPFFRFTSRYVNAIMVTFIAFYYFVVKFAISFIFTPVLWFTSIMRELSNIPLFKILEEMITELNSQDISFNANETCQIVGSPSLCEHLEPFLNINFTLPKLPESFNALNNRLNKTLEQNPKITLILMYLQKIDIPTSIEAILIVPIFVAFAICLVQLFLFVRETRLHLKQLQRGSIIKLILVCFTFF